MLALLGMLLILLVWAPIELLLLKLGMPYDTPSWVLSSVLTCIVIAAVVAAFNKREETQKARAWEEETTREIMQIREYLRQHPDHIHVLRRIYHRSVYEDEFGDLQVDDWVKRLTEYVREKTFVPEPDRAYVSKFWVELERVWDEEPKPAPTAYSNGAEYERQCLDVLRRRGFEVQLTGGTGDQGADLIASKGRYRIAIQCKLYSSPVGNAAVQQAEASRRFYDCTHAVVASDAGFTKAARQLASKLGVALLSTAELARLRKSMLLSQAVLDRA